MYITHYIHSIRLYEQHEQDYTIHHLCKLLDLLLDMKHCLIQINAMYGRNLVLRAGQFIYMLQPLAMCI